jgi:lipopolysaccharide/colanic/teichoic acid biosynthesis glycosyltransferase
MIKLDSRGPVLFRQRRVGRGDQRFEVLKFRSMYVDAEARKTAVADLNFHGGGNDNGMFKIKEDPRVTRVGRLLRRTSLDELPQLINVLKGDMSLVGPRPCIPYETEVFEPHHLERFAMPQGITGLWQVTARANCTYGEALDMDVAYVRSWSLWLDLRLLLRTPLQVLRQRTSTA